MTYWVYENWRHKRARIHKSECSQCNNGRGKRGTNTSGSGRWLGPYESRDHASRMMHSIDQPDRGTCHFCSSN